MSLRWALAGDGSAGLPVVPAAATGEANARLRAGERHGFFDRRQAQFQGEPGGAWRQIQELVARNAGSG